MSQPCSVCGDNLFPKHGCDEFPSLTLCYPCLRDWFEWMHTNRVSDGNPLIAAWWPYSFSIPVESIYESMSWTTVPLKGFKLVPIK